MAEKQINQIQTTDKKREPFANWISTTTSIKSATELKSVFEMDNN